MIVFSLVSIRERTRWRTWFTPALTRSCSSAQHYVNTPLAGFHNFVMVLMNL